MIKVHSGKVVVYIPMEILPSQKESSVHLDEHKRHKHIKRQCPRVCWKGTDRSHICNGTQYKYGVCYYHWKKTYSHEMRTGPNSKGHRGGNRW